MKEECTEGAVIGLVYFAICIFTFGHAYNNYVCEEKNVDCVASRWVVSGVDALFSPLYWSVTLQEKKP